MRLEGEIERNQVELVEAGIRQLQDGVRHQFSDALSRSEANHLSAPPSLTSQLNRQSVYSV